MIAVHYFASIRESLGIEHENIELPKAVDTVEKLIDHLVSQHGSQWGEVLNANPVMVAVNHEMSGRSAAVAAGDEIAFFPPVTGG